MQEYNKKERNIMINYLEKRVSLLEEVIRTENLLYKATLQSRGVDPWEIEELIYLRESQEEAKLCKLLGIICYLDDYKRLRATLSKEIIEREDKLVNEVYQELKRLKRI